MTSVSGKIDPVVRRITAADIAEALGQGLRDFQARWGRACAISRPRRFTGWRSARCMQAAAS